MITKTKIRIMPCAKQQGVAIERAEVPQIQVVKGLGVDPRASNQLINGDKNRHIYDPKTGGPF